MPRDSISITAHAPCVQIVSRPDGSAMVAIRSEIRSAYGVILPGRKRFVYSKCVGGCRAALGYRAIGNPDSAVDAVHKLVAWVCETVKLEV